MEPEVELKQTGRMTGGRTNTRPCPQCGLAVSTTQSSCPVDGTILDPFYQSGQLFDSKYEFIELIGSGGMGVIYKARQIVLNKIVAIKMLHTDLLTDKALKRFQREGKAASALDHTNIIAVHDFAVSTLGQPYMVMDYVEGQTLDDKIRIEGLLSVDYTLNAMIQICDGLSHAHKNGVLHRDLKPSNVVMISNGDNPPIAKILDFGIAKLMDTADSGTQAALTQTGDTLGSPLYMSPEQCFGKEVDKRSELYALGCTMYECLCGLPPFVGSSLANIVVKISNEPPPPMKDASLGQDFSPVLENIILKLLSKNPDDRYQSADELKWDLVNFQEHADTVPKEPVFESTRVVVPPPDPRPAKLIAAVSAAACILALVLIGVTIQHFTQKVPSTVQPALPASVTGGTIGGANRPDLDIKSAVKQWVQDHPNADTINLGYWELSDDDMPPLATERQCTVMNLPGNSIKGYGLRYLQGLTKIVNLRIDKNDLNDDSLVYLRDMTKMQSLNLKQTGIMGPGLEHLANIPLLYLDLANCAKLTPQGMAPIRNLTSLATLNLDGTTFDDECIPYLQPLKNLRVLDLSHTQISDAGASQIAKSETIRELWLNGTAIDDRCMKNISRMRDLVQLDVSGTAVTAVGIKQLAAAKNLNALYCVGCTGDMIGAFAEIKRHLPNCQLLLKPRH